MLYDVAAPGRPSEETSLTLDVFDGASNTILAQRSIPAFALPFVSRGPMFELEVSTAHVLEFRVFWHGHDQLVAKGVQIVGVNGR